MSSAGRPDGRWTRESFINSGCEVAARWRFLLAQHRVRPNSWLVHGGSDLMGCAGRHFVPQGVLRERWAEDRMCGAKLPQQCQELSSSRD
jgi:hypothetical protein